MQKLLLTCDSQDPHHHINTAVSQQGHFQSRGCTFLLFPFGFERCPDAGSEDQQVEKRYCNHTWYVHSHDWLASSVNRDNNFLFAMVSLLIHWDWIQKMGRTFTEQLFVLSNWILLINYACKILTTHSSIPAGVRIKLTMNSNIYFINVVNLFQTAISQKRTILPEKDNMKLFLFVHFGSVL